MKNHPSVRFYTLIFNIFIAGLTQGMLLPLLSLMMEKSNYSSTLNGISQAVLPLGIMICLPFSKSLLEKYGYRPVLLVGSSLVAFSILLFPFWQSFVFWIFLRLVIGFGSNLLHFSTQVWITSTGESESRGRSISLYGFSFGLGFFIGPSMIHLLNVSPYLPFIAGALLTSYSIIAISLLKNEMPSVKRSLSEGSQNLASSQQYGSVLKVAWVAILPCFAYGFLEYLLTSSLPVHLVRNSFETDEVVTVLRAFSLSALIATVPQGFLSDKIGRRKLIILDHVFGITAFALATLFSDHFYLFSFFVAISGLCFGALFSLGISYLVDLLPKESLSAGNLLISLFYGIGSMIGPISGGLFMEAFPDANLMLLLAMVFTTLLFVILLNPVGKEREEEMDLLQAEPL